MLTIGLVNNMPFAAIQSTERQFRDILKSAGPDISFRIRWFRLSGPRPVGYEALDDLRQASLDGLIVTGAEPRTEALQDEPIWSDLTTLVEWASEHTSSTIFSCLAAHAAVLYLDGIERCRHAEKIFGVFDSIKVSDHPLLANIPDRWRVPHSRWNDLPEEELAARGYTVLARSRDAGVDLFTKQSARSLFVFIQTHPEYFPNTLLREFLRDITRFDNGQQQAYPAVPQNCFGEDKVAFLNALRHAPERGRQLTEEELRGHSEMLEGWRPFALQLYRNWLLHLRACALHDMASA